MRDYPGLANRAQGLLAYRLTRFRSGITEDQQQETMLPFAKPLSYEPIDTLTTFLNEFHDDETQRYESAFQTWGDAGS